MWAVEAIRRLERAHRAYDLLFQSNASTTRSLALLALMWSQHRWIRGRGNHLVTVTVWHVDRVLTKVNSFCCGIDISNNIAVKLQGVVTKWASVLEDKQKLHVY